LQKIKGEDTYLIIEYDVFIVFIIALHAHIFTIATQPVFSPLSLNPFCACLLCPTGATLPQPVAEKGTAGIFRVPRSRHWGKEAGAEIKTTWRFISWTRIIRA
jgi:hypothetical protein